MKTKGKVLEDNLKMTLLARVIPNLPLDETRKWVKDIVRKFEFGHYFKEHEKLVREDIIAKMKEMRDKREGTRLSWDLRTMMEVIKIIKKGEVIQNDG